MLGTNEAFSRVKIDTQLRDQGWDVLKDAIRDGFLVPCQIYKAKTVKTAADGGFLAEFEHLFGNEQSILIDPGALERRFTIPERNRAIVREFRDVMEKGYTDAKGVVRKEMRRA